MLLWSRTATWPESKEPNLAGWSAGRRELNIRPKPQASADTSTTGVLNLGSDYQSTQ
jgi:hypothetical protein